MAVTRIKTNQVTDLAVTNAKLANGTITGGKLATGLVYPDDLTISGNLQVNGTTSTVNTTNMIVTDPLLLLAAGTAGAPANDTGIVIERGTSINVAIVWDETDDVFAFLNTTDVGTGTGAINKTDYVDIRVGTITSDDAIIASGTLGVTGLSTQAAITASGTITANGGIIVGAAQTIDVGANKITNLAEPTLTDDAATKNYVDITSLFFKISDETPTTRTINSGNILLFAGTTNQITTTVSSTDTVTFAFDTNVTMPGDLSVTGNFTVNGTTTTVNSTVVAVDDPIFTVGGDVAPVSDDLLDKGVAFRWHNGATAKVGFFGFDRTNTRLIYIPDATISSEVVSGTLGDFDINGVFANTITTTGAASFNSISGVTGNSVFSTLSTSGLATLESAAVTNNITSTNGNIDYTNGFIEAGEIRLSGQTLSVNTGIMSLQGVAGSEVVLNESGADINLRVEAVGEANAFFIEGSTGKIAVGTAAPNPNATIDFGTGVNDAMIVPKGTTAQRPATGVTGMFRFNTTTDLLEYYDSDSWETVDPVFTTVTSQVFVGTGAQVAFTLSVVSAPDSYTSANVLIAINGIIQEPIVAYSVSGITLTFTAAPADGDTIEVRKLTTTDTIIGLSDSDGDTRVQVEATTDEDIVRIVNDGTETARFDATNHFKVGTTATNAYHEIVGVNTGVNTIGLQIAPGTSSDVINFYKTTSGSSPSATDASMTIQRDGTTSRSINAAGTVNAAGTDYAEYMTKSTECGTIAKGDVCGIDRDGNLTDIFHEAHSFAIKSTDPSYVGGDKWFTQPRPKQNGESNVIFKELLKNWATNFELARASVDRIAFAGRVPCNISGVWRSGDYVIPKADEFGMIVAVAVTSPSFEEYQLSVGKIWGETSNKRPNVTVKVV